MNIFFTKLIKIRGLLREVNFRKLPTGEAAYHVDTTDERGARFMLTARRGEGGTWTFTAAALPAWMAEAEPLFCAAIEEEEAALQGSKRTA